MPGRALPPPDTGTGLGPRCGRKGGATARPAPASTALPALLARPRLQQGPGTPQESRCLSQGVNQDPPPPGTTDPRVPSPHSQTPLFAGSLRCGEATPHVRLAARPGSWKDAGDELCTPGAPSCPQPPPGTQPARGHAASGQGTGNEATPGTESAAAVPSPARLTEAAGDAPVLPVTPGTESCPQRPPQEQRTNPSRLPNALTRMRLHINWHVAAVQVRSQRDNKKIIKIQKLSAAIGCFPGPPLPARRGHRDAKLRPSAGRRSWRPAQSAQCAHPGRRKQKHQGSYGREINTITEGGQGTGNREQGTKPLEAALMSTGSESALPPPGP